MNLLRNPLYQAIVANVEDDTPRLVFADWLDEHDQPEWAEFIRVQCRLAAIDEAEAEVPALQRRERELVIRHCETWLASLARHRGMSYGDMNVGNVFQRGFPVSAKFQSVESFERALPRLIGESTIRKATVRISTRRGENQRIRTMLANEPLMQHIQELSFAESPPNFDASVLRAMADSPHLTGLQSLNLDYLELEETAFVQLLNAPQLARLHSLSFRYARWLDPLIVAISDPVHANRWRSLLMGPRQSASMPFIPLFDSPALQHCHTLAFTSVSLNEVSIPPLSESTMLDNLHRLDLGTYWFDRDEIAQLTNSSWMPQLRHLTIEVSHETAGIALIQSTALRSLLSLELQTSAISGELAQALWESPHIRQLRSLDLTGNGLPPEIESGLRDRMGDAFLYRTVISSS